MALTSQIALLQQQREQTPKLVQKNRCKLSTLASAPELFQPRTYENNEEHVKALSEALERAGPSGDLDPILIWKSDQIYVLDGHHRLEAYERCSRPSIPVEWFQGSVTQAIAKAIEINAKIKLNLQYGDRMDAAWKLTVLHYPGNGNEAQRPSRAELSRTCGISQKSVQNMRKAAKTIGSEQGLEQLNEITTWKEALEMVTPDTETTAAKTVAEIDANAQKIADQLSKKMGVGHVRNPKNILTWSLGLRYWLDHTFPNVVESGEMFISETQMNIWNAALDGSRTLDECLEQLKTCIGEDDDEEDMDYDLF